jgi:uncharacterized membrane protein
VISNAVFITAFLASSVEAIEMVTNVVGVGAARGGRSTPLGAGADRSRLDALRHDGIWM